MNDKEVSFLPFHAINEFMTSEYRIKVIRSTLEALPSLPNKYQSTINRLIKKFVKVPGFRNSIKAPISVKVKPLAKAFEKNPDLVAALIQTWSKARTDLSLQVFDLLSGRDWDLLPLDADRSKLPGFLPNWPKDENFDVLNSAFSEMYPEDIISTDDISLMVVWLSGRLPYQLEDEEEELK